MKRLDFKNITKEHFETCYKIIENGGICGDLSCDKCPFYKSNSTNRKLCIDNGYKGTPFPHAKDMTLLNSAKEFLKFRKEKNMKYIFMYNGEIYEKVSEYKDLITVKKVNWYEYVYNALSVCEQEDNGFFIRKDHKGLYYCEPYTQEYNTTEKILCVNDGYRIEVILSILNNLCPDFNEFIKLANEL